MNLEQILMWGAWVPFFIFSSKLLLMQEWCMHVHTFGAGTGAELASGARWHVLPCINNFFLYILYNK